MQKKEINLSVVIPCYNEGENIYNNLLEMSKIISNFEKNYEMICVNDGSLDCTEQEIKKASKKDGHIKCVTYSKNMGKGYALKIGTSKAEGKIISFIDSDLELSPIYIEHYINLMNDTQADVVIASKMHKDSILDYPLRRKVLSLGYYLILKLLFQLNIKDTQTGLKVFKADAVKGIMANLETNGFAFDIELLALMNQKGYKIVDAPICLNFTREHSMGRIKLKDILNMGIDTIKVFYKIKFHKEKRITKMDNQKELYFFIGTEAELMKMYHIILEAKRRDYIVHIVSNGQNIITNSPYLEIIDEKIDIDLTKYAPKEKGMKNYLGWFVKTRRLGIKTLKKILKNKNNDNCLFIVHGDTLSTLMGAMIANKSRFPYVHVESGLRSYNWLSPFPEEIDRYFSSKKSLINFCPNEEATKYAKKHFKGKAINTYFNTGIEILYDALAKCRNNKEFKTVEKSKYFLFAIHRQENLLNKNFMKNTVDNICKLSKKIKCVFIYHEQTKNAMEEFELWAKIVNNKNIKMIERQDYINFINIVDHAEFVIGDGCGNQQEFYYLGKPYLILRTHVEDKSEGINWNAKPFENNFANILTFFDEYKDFKKKQVKMDKIPSKIVIDEIDSYFNIER